MDPSSLGEKLLNLVDESEPIDLVVRDERRASRSSEALLDEEGNLPGFVREARALLDRLEGALADANWAPSQGAPAWSDQGNWSFGLAMTLRRPEREIHRGSVQPLRRVPILARVPERVVLYLITVVDGEDYLKREAHSGVGWHYHYLDKWKNRSNVVLCWDTRWSAPVRQGTPAARRGLFVEPHGERDNADFEAKPGLWGPRKRQTLYEACAPDLRQWPIGEFRCASNKAQAVYPPTAVLTPHPSNIAGVAGASTAFRAKKAKR